MGQVSERIAMALQEYMEVVSGDVDEICRDAAGRTASDWRVKQALKATSIGAAAAAIPVYSYLTLPADLTATLRIMHRCATGMCFIILGHADEETYAGVLAVWSGEVQLDDNLAKQVAAKALATAGSTVGGQLGLKLSIKAFNICTTAIVTKKLGPKVAQKVAAKLTSKLAAKATTRWIPIISAFVGGGTNLWILDGIADAAEEYSRFILRSQPPPPAALPPNA